MGGIALPFIKESHHAVDTGFLWCKYSRYAKLLFRTIHHTRLLINDPQIQVSINGFGVYLNGSLQQWHRFRMPSLLHEEPCDLIQTRGTIRATLQHEAIFALSVAEQPLLLVYRGQVDTNNIRRRRILQGAGLEYYVVLPLSIPAHNPEDRKERERTECRNEDSAPRSLPALTRFPQSTQTPGQYPAKSH